MRRLLTAPLLALLFVSPGGASPPQAGPLLILGGGVVPAGARGRCLELAGVEEARVVILPQASGRDGRGTGSVAPWTKAGAGAVVLLDPLDESSLAEIARADVIWLPGGSQSRLMRELREAKLVEAIRKRHAAGAVVAGSSAGAAVMSRAMITGDAELEAVRAGATEIAEGLGLWPGVIVDQHFVARRRNNRLLAAVLDRPQLVGVGIDEDTGVVVGPKRFEVIGRGTVVVYDAREATVEEHEPGQRHGAIGLRVHVLRAGMSLARP